MGFGSFVVSALRPKLVPRGPPKQVNSRIVPEGKRLFVCDSRPFVIMYGVPMRVRPLLARKVLTKQLPYPPTSDALRLLRSFWELVLSVSRLL